MINIEKKALLISLLSINYLLQAKQPTTLFCHGIVDNKSQANRYESFLTEPKENFNFPDAQQPCGWNLNNLIFNICSLFGKTVHRENMHMGQGDDIQTLESQIKKNDTYILYGVSRGGATILSYLAQYNPKNIQAIIIDAAPADVVSAVDELQHAAGCKFAPTRSSQEYIFSTLFPAFKQGNTPPVKDLVRIKNKNLPILIVHSLQDSRVHIRSAWQLYSQLIQASFTDVYLCQLPEGKHAFYMQGNSKDLYLQAVHSFYKKYNFIYNTDYAIMELKELQPALDIVVKKINDDQATTILNYEKQRTINMTLILAAAIIAEIIYAHKNRYLL